MPVQLIESFKSAIATKALSVLGYGKLQQVQSSFTIQAYNQIYPSWYSYKVIKAYKTLDDIFSVVNRLAKTSAAIPLWGYNSEMEDLPATDKLAVFLRSLTYNQKLELYTWLYLRGECFIYKVKTLGVNGKVDKLHFINPSCVSLILTNEWPEYVEQYWYVDHQRGLDIKIPADEIMFIKNFNPSDDYQQSWRGLSPVDVLVKRLTRMESNMNNSVAQMQNGGVPGVMYAKDVPNTAPGKVVIDAMKDNFSRFLKNSDNKGAPMIQAGEMGYFAIGSDLVDMESIALEKIDFKKICNAWGISDVLFNSDSAATESNVKEMIRQMYLNAVKPTVTMVEDCFNTELVTDFGAGIRIIKHDFDGIPELQESMQDKMIAMAAAPVMIPNDILEAMGYQRDPNPMMDMPLIKTGYQPIDDFEPLPPIE